jgi:lipopolysaccharide biosynthesis glycosyltransferase
VLTHLYTQKKPWMMVLTINKSCVAGAKGEYSSILQSASRVAR